ncbi:MAG: DUF4292 domain-containing protein [Cyclobacteriaceae bacterium]|nr:MAG: DUF4292 domain-containing protein [Cyclobacteriaceae bacterium]
MNKDSITVVSNLDKEYYVFDYKELSTRFNFEINYKVLEAAMLGNPIRAKQNTDEIGREGESDVLLQSENSVVIKILLTQLSEKLKKLNW